MVLILSIRRHPEAEAAPPFLTGTTDRSGRGVRPLAGLARRKDWFGFTKSSRQDHRSFD